MRRNGIVAGAIVLATGLAGPAAAQVLGVQVTPTVGAHYAGRGLSGLNDNRPSFSGEALALGLNLELSAFRVSLVYGSAATIAEDGSSGRDRIGEGKLLAVAGDLVMRPIPRLLGFQPYLLGGAGLKNEQYSWDENGVRDALPSDGTDFALHFGIGADLQLGRVGVMAEASDHMTVGSAPLGRHDSFIMAGLRIRLF